MERDFLNPMIEQQRQQLMENRLKEAFFRDAEQETPVVQMISLFFWQNMARWMEQIALASGPFVIALSGPSGSGKSFIRETLVRELSQVTQVSSFTQDNYYRDFEADFPQLSPQRFYDEIDLDAPAHIRFRHLLQDMQQLRKSPLGSVMSIQKLQFGTPARKPTIIERGLELEVSPFVVTEGIHAFYEPAVLPLYDFKIYVDIDEPTRRSRWLARNQRENRGTTDNMWNTTVECLEKHILPTRSVADIVVNNRASREQVAAFLQDIVSILASPEAMTRKDIA